MYKKIVSIVIALVAMFSIFLVGCSTESELTTNTNQQENIVNDFSAEIINTDHVVISMSEIMSMSTETSISKTLTATVLPATATNKTVDWSCEWADSENTANVSDYVTVTPLSSGSTTATVTCYNAFTDNIVITVTTRESGYSATCTVSFIGIPTDISISGAISPVSGEYLVGIGETYEFDVTLSNPFNSVGAEFNDITCGITGVGSVVLGYMEHYNTSNTDVWFDDGNKTVTLDSLKDNFISASFADGELSVTTIKSIESYYALKKGMDSGRTMTYTDKFRSYVDDCYFKVWVKENQSGLTNEYILRFDESIVTSISIDNGEIFF